jgi:hypothetical protein
MKKKLDTNLLVKIIIGVVILLVMFAFHGLGKSDSKKKSISIEEGSSQ